MKFTFLVENKTDRVDCMAEHGLSIFIENDGKKILFDAGNSDMFLKNAKALGINLADVDLAMVSHGHYDHTGGFPYFLEINKTAQIYIHKDAFFEDYHCTDIKFKRNCGINWNKEEKEKILSRSILTEKPVWIDENTVISGTIPEIKDIQTSDPFIRKYESGETEIDDMSHEQFLAIRTPKGIVLFSGCSHKGVIPAVKYARELFNGENVKLLVAGMHLFRTSKEISEKIIDELIELNVEKIVPVHCTGLKAIAEISKRLEDNCIIMTSGSSYEF